MKLPRTMHAWRVEALDDAGTMHRREIALPVPAADEHLLRVEAAGVAFGDTLIVRGRYQVKPALPFTPGSDVVGRVVGDDPLAGTRVASSTSRQGGFAEYVRVPRHEVVAIGDDMPAGAALALRSNFPISLYALRHAAALKAGDTVLVHAAAGGVGSAALLLGKRMGARVIATAAQSLRCLAYGARYLVIGFAGGTLTPLPANRLLLHNGSAIGVLWGEVRKRDPALSAGLTHEIFAAWHAGELPLPPGRPFAFDEAPLALAALAGRESIGKLWLDLQAVR